MSSASAASTTAGSDIWNPAQYLLFEDMRARPGLELIARVEHTLKQFSQTPSTVRRVVDLGCGTGKLALKLASVFPQASVQGVDSSANMLEQAQAATEKADDEVKKRVSWKHCGFEEFNDNTGVDLIFSNAALHWTPVSSHVTLYPHLLRQLKSPGGILAVQIPNNFREQSHLTMYEALEKGKFFSESDLESLWSKQPDVHVQGAMFYYNILAPHARHVDVWQTDYLQPLTTTTQYHPVLEWTKSTALAPILAGLPSDKERTRFQEIYSDLLEKAYPSKKNRNGEREAVLIFKRIFMIAVA